MRLLSLILLLLTSSGAFANDSAKTFYITCQVSYYVADGVLSENAVSNEVTLDSAIASPATVNIPMGSEAIIARLEGLGTTINAFQPTFSVGLYDLSKKGIASEKAVSYVNDLSLDSRSVGKVATLTGRSYETRSINSNSVERIDYTCWLIRKN